MFSNLAQMYRSRPMMDGGFNDNLGHPWAAMAAMAIFTIFAVVILIYVIRWISSLVSTHAKLPIDIAKDRLAKGEITKAQFEEIKKEL